MTVDSDASMQYAALAEVSKPSRSMSAGPNPGSFERLQVKATAQVSLVTCSRLTAIEICQEVLTCRW